MRKFFLSLVLLVLASHAQVWAQSAYDGRRDGFLFNGKQNMPFVLYGAAIKWHQDCLAGRVDECVRLAGAFERGEGDLKRDLRVVIGYLMKACELGSGPSCARASAIFRDGSATFTNVELAQKMAERGCNELKNQASCAALAASLANASGGGADPSRATALIESACAADDDDGCRMKANALFHERKDAASRAEAIAMYEKACTGKRAWGCLGMAVAYNEGWGVAQDRTRGGDYAHIGCTQTQGDRLRLCTLYGNDLVRQRKDKASLNKGEQYLDASCNGGDGSACVTLGLVGLNQLPGATTTMGEAVYYLRRGCDLSHGPACNNLAESYEHAAGVPKDVVVAFALHEKACKLEEAKGCDGARKLSAADTGIRSRVPAIDPSLAVADQLRRAKAAVDSGDKDQGVRTVVRLMQEHHEDAEWLLGGWLYYGLPGVFDRTRRADGLTLIENAARVGHIDAAIWMGMAYWYGDGVAVNRAKGEEYMAIAGMRGSEMATAIFRSMRAEPERQENARRQAALEEAIRRQRENWTSSWSNYKPSWSPSPTRYTPYSGRSTAQIIDAGNWNQRINYLSGATTACPRSNSYCR